VCGKGEERVCGRGEEKAREREREGAKEVIDQGVECRDVRVVKQHQLLLSNHQFSIKGQLLCKNVKRSRGGLVFKVDRLVYHSTLGLRVIKKRRRRGSNKRSRFRLGGFAFRARGSGLGVPGSGFRVPG
jgi:hypothetical protein